MREMGLFKLEKKWELRRDLISIFTCLTGGYREGGGDFMTHSKKRQAAHFAARDILIT